MLRLGLGQSNLCHISKTLCTKPKQKLRLNITLNCSLWGQIEWNLISWQSCRHANLIQHVSTGRRYVARGQRLETSCWWIWWLQYLCSSLPRCSEASCLVHLRNEESGDCYRELTDCWPGAVMGDAFHQMTICCIVLFLHTWAPFPSPEMSIYWISESGQERDADLRCCTHSNCNL